MRGTVTADRENLNLGERRRKDTNHENVSRVFWGTLQSKLNIYYFPQPAAPHLQLKLYLAASRAYTVQENSQPPKTQSVRYHSLSGTVSFRLEGSYMFAIKKRPG
jgi:hypothetical protein